MATQRGQTDLAEPDAHSGEEHTLRPLQAAAVTDHNAALGADDRFTAANSPLRMSLQGRQRTAEQKGSSRSMARGWRERIAQW